MVDRPRPDAARRRQHAGGSVAEPRQAVIHADPLDRPRRQRRPSPGALEARRAGGEGRLRIRLHHHAAQARRRHRLDRCADRDPAIRFAQRNVARRCQVLPHAAIRWRRGGRTIQSPTAAVT